MVVFDPNQSIEQIRQHAQNMETTLTAYFKANADPVIGGIARQYTYQEFPQHFVWNKDQKAWVVRQRGFAIGRMYFVPPNGGERFYLRTLLTATKGVRL